MIVDTSFDVLSLSQVLTDCNVFVRACAAAALRDVTTYFTKEEGQVAVSERTTESVLYIHT